MATQPTDKEIEESIGRLALTADGMALYRYLVRALQSIAPDAEGGGALPLHEGRRRFAHELKRLMDRQLQNVTLSSDRTDTDALAHAIGPAAEPIRASGARGVTRRVVPYADESVKSA